MEVTISATATTERLDAEEQKWMCREIKEKLGILLRHSLGLNKIRIDVHIG